MRFIMLGMSEAPLTLLLVEDDIHDAVLLESVLQEVAPEVQLVHVLDAAAAFHQLSLWEGQLPPLLILLDLELPGRHGHEVLEELKTDAALRPVPVIVFSSSEEQAVINRSYHLHANAYLVKPQSVDGYRKLVEAVLHYWRSAARLPVPQTR